MGILGDGAILRISTIVLAFLLLLSLAANCFADVRSVLSEIEEPQEKEVRNPFALASLSLVPGVGQMASGNVGKGFFFLTTSGIVGWISLNQWMNYHKSYQRIYAARDSLSAVKKDRDLYRSDSAFWRDTIFWTNRIALAEYSNSLQKARYYNASAMFASIGIWNILDAVGGSNAASGAKNPQPRKAMALSAIPFTGAGQFYNGEWFKAGLVMAAQTSFVFGGAQFQYLMYKTQKHSQDLSRDENFKLLAVGDRVNAWRSNYSDAARRRTMFFWYAIIFYIYGMTDAYVDASLSNFERKFDISPSFSPANDEISIGLTFRF